MEKLPDINLLSLYWRHPTLVDTLCQTTSKTETQPHPLAESLTVHYLGVLNFPLSKDVYDINKL